MHLTVLILLDTRTTLFSFKLIYWTQRFLCAFSLPPGDLIFFVSLVLDSMTITVICSFISCHCRKCSIHQHQVTVPLSYTVPKRKDCSHQLAVLYGSPHNNQVTKGAKVYEKLKEDTLFFLTMAWSLHVSCWEIPFCLKIKLPYVVDFPVTVVWATEHIFKMLDSRISIGINGIKNLMVSDSLQGLDLRSHQALRSAATAVLLCQSKD